MQRLIRSFNTLTDDLREKLQEQFPDGIDNSHIRTVSTPKGESLRVIELRTADAIYLIKVNAESREEIDQFLEQEDGGDDDRGGDDVDSTDELEGADDADDEEEEDTDAPTDDGDEDDED
jgi:hypothetical protein